MKDGHSLKLNILTIQHAGVFKLGHDKPGLDLAEKHKADWSVRK